LAAHVRSQIRAAVAGALVGLATTGARVFESRVYPLETADLPGLTVQTDGEQVLGISIDAPRTLQRTLQLVVAGFAQVTVDLDADLDQIAKEVEVAMAMPMAAVAGLAKDIRLVAVQIEMAGTAQKPTGRIALIYEVDYFTLENAPDVAH
jgi:hypothetical protein